MNFIKLHFNFIFIQRAVRSQHIDISNLYPQKKSLLIYKISFQHNIVFVTGQASGEEG